MFVYGVEQSWLGSIRFNRISINSKDHLQSEQIAPQSHKLVLGIRIIDIEIDH